MEEYKKSVEEYSAYREKLSRHNRIKQRNMVRFWNLFQQSSGYFLTFMSGNPENAKDLNSLRCSAILKLDQAEKFQDFEEIFFPYNLDFRGRSYPVPPHLSNVGSDLCRGMLKFAEEKPLGQRGLYWLKVHLANFAGKDKMTFDARVKYVDDNMDHIRASASDPFAGERWWMSLEDPFQGLATCMEIVRAVDSGDPASYKCGLPVHMDGSCNGLQHYAALGRDPVGGKAVNLCDLDEPQDVYIGVMQEVARRVSEQARRAPDFDIQDRSKLSAQQLKELRNYEGAKLVDGLIDRGVVKRTVMTSVYGVTFVGARKQISEKIEEKVCLHSICAAILLPRLTQFIL
jgi:DNA-directed RNA polymerase